MSISVGPGWRIGSGWGLTTGIVGTTPTLVSGATVVAQSPYTAGGTAYSFNGTNNYVTYDGSAGQTAFGTGDFTIEYFINYASITGRRDSVWWGASNSDRGGLIYNFTAGNLTYYISPTVAAAVNYAWTPTLNTWYHVALVKISGNTRLYVGGTLVGTPTPYTGTKSYSGTGYTVPTTQLEYTQSAGTNISAITAGQCNILMGP